MRSTSACRPCCAALTRRLRDGLRLFQVRDKNLPERTAFIREATALARRHGARVLVNGETHLTAAQLLETFPHPARRRTGRRVLPHP